MHLITHRGNTKKFVENTISACELALSQGASGIEIDIRETASGELVVFHDFSLKRMFSRSGYIGRTTLDELKNLPYTNSDDSTPQFIETLDNFLDHFKKRVPINLDAKTIHFFDFKFADKIISTIRNHDLYDTVWISCFNPFLLQILKLKDKNVRTGYLFQRIPQIHLFYDIVTWTDAWHPHCRIVTEKFVNRAAKNQKQVYVWTVNTLEEMRRLRNFNIDGIISDNIAELSSGLENSK